MTAIVVLHVPESAGMLACAVCKHGPIDKGNWCGGGFGSASPHHPASGAKLPLRFLSFPEGKPGAWEQAREMLADYGVNINTLKRELVEADDLQ